MLLIVNSWGQTLGVKSCVLADLDSFDWAADGGVVDSVVGCDLSLFVASGIVRIQGLNSTTIPRVTRIARP